MEGTQGVRTLDRESREAGTRDGAGVAMVELHSAAKFEDRCPILLARARDEIFFASAPVIAGVRAPLTSSREPLLAALRRHVRVAFLEDSESLEASGRKQFLHELRSRGASVRVTGSGVIGMVIVDRRWALVCNNPAGDRQCCVSTCSAAIVAVLQQLADRTWRASWDLDLLPLIERRDWPVLLAVMRVLGAGYKDELGARLLGISLRSYRRHVADLLHILGADSRFEAGARAARLGLLP
ncbi:MAG TPA: hypothetical protein VKS82_15185 [Streptosporangiaceae bacterium]|nr:hypothetical protein [Streptosporangiaceae bacterium]